MGTENTAGPGMAWLGWAFLTVVSWGVYGVFLHTGSLGMADPANGRIFVVAAVLQPENWTASPHA